MASCTSPTVSSNNNFGDCVGLNLTSSFNCPGIYEKSKSNCDTGNRNLRFDAYLATNLVTTNIKTLTFTINKGYNILKNFGSPVEMKPGYVLVISSQTVGGPGPLIDLDQTSTGLSDFEIVAEKLQRINGTFRVNTIVSPFDKVVSVGYKYTGQALRTINVNLKNNLISGNDFNLTQNVMIYEDIQGLIIVTASGVVCNKDKDCILIASVTKGKDLTYNWTVEGQSFVTNDTQYIHVFRTVGLIEITLIAYNPLTSKNTTLFITVTDRLEGLNFKSGNSQVSASAVGKPGNFLFTLQAGANYKCDVKYGNRLFSFNDSVYNMNNSIFSNVYSSEGIYKVKIYCENSVNNISLEFNHYVQFEITGLQLKSNATVVNTAYYIECSILSGSGIFESILYFDNKLEALTITGLNGRGILHNGELRTTIHNISITLRNYVSTVQLNGTFEISAPIINPKFEITPAGDLGIEKYSFPVSHKIKISMDGGANVRMKFNTDFYGGQLLNGINLITINLVGDWIDNVNETPNKYVIDYTFVNPGDYLIKLELWNTFGSFVLSKQISIISTVFDLIPGVIDLNPNNYVVFQTADGINGKGLAEYAFQYSGNTKAGSHAEITFWPGDILNANYGTFKFEMDFNKNISKTSLQYNYVKPGDYEVKFFVSNPRGSKAFSMLVRVVVGMFGFYIDVNPKAVPPSTPFTASAYMVQGYNVSYKFFVNDAQLGGVQARTGDFYFYLKNLILLKNLSLSTCLRFKNPSLRLET